MSYDFLTLVNMVNEKLNEVPLTSSTFAEASGVYSDNKNAVNVAIRNINTISFEWPFNHVVKELVLTPNTVRYNYEVDCKSIAFNTFRVKGDDTLMNNTQSLAVMDYEQYLRDCSDMEYRPTRYAALPKAVVRTPTLQFGVVPPPNKAYTLVYEYYKLPLDLVLYSDVPTIPEVFKNVIFDGAMQYAYMFRGDVENAALSKSMFDEGRESMRTIFINRTEYARDYMVWRSR